MSERCWLLSESMFLRALRRVEQGEAADLVYAEVYANAEVQQVEGE